MKRSRQSRDRGNRNRSSKASKLAKKSKKRADEPRFRRHRMYGHIPLVRKSHRTSTGRLVEWWDYDPAYRPKMPKGAVRADVLKQQFCSMCHVPMHYYVDQHKTCVQCGEEFVFSAAEQKYWYESLRFYLGSVAIRCRPCRKQQRSQKALRHQIAAALEKQKAEPDNLACDLELAEATVRYRELTGEGDLDRAIAATRRVQKLWPEAVEAAFWEARCHALAGRREKAEALFRHFLDNGRKRRRYKQLARVASSYLELEAAAAE